MRYFEDFFVGESIDLGHIGVTEDEIIAFATQFDPQPFHVNKEQALHSFFGELVASGWHTTSLDMRMLVDGLLNQSASLASPGVEQVRWLKPVRPGDTLYGRFTIVDATTSKSRPTLGILRSNCEMFNQHGELVMTLAGTHFMGRRPTEALED